LGYKSVAHYLIQTRRANTDDVEKNDDASNPVSAKRSLPFSDDASDNKSHEMNENKLESMQSLAEAETDSGEVVTKRSLIFPDEQDQLAKFEKVEGLGSDDNKSHEVYENKLGSMQPLAEAETNGDEVATKRPDQIAMLEKAEGLDSVKPLASTKQSPDEEDQLVKHEKVEGSDTVKPPASSTKPTPDSIAGRLRSRTSRLQKP
jgi:hypothetical protein